MQKRMSKQVMVGQVAVGGGAPISVQSMLNVPAHDIAGNVAQALRLQACGCDIIRTAVPDKEAVALVAALKEALTIPVVADIHFDYQLALESAAAGVDKIRINPGNIFFCSKFGVEDHMHHIGCDKSFYKEHLYGIAYFVNMVDSEKGKKYLCKLDEINW